MKTQTYERSADSKNDRNASPSLFPIHPRNLSFMIESLVLCYSHCLPYHPGKWRVIEALIRGLRLDAARPPSVVTRQNLKWKLGTACRVQRALFWHGAFDRNDSRMLLEPLGAGTVFFDVGSYFGYYALLAAQRGAVAYAFEPSPANFELLKEQVALNALPVHPFEVALSDTAGTATFSLASDDNRGRGSLGALDAAHGGTGTHQVQTMTLDAFVLEHGITRIDAMKLDVEGAELRVLAGAKETLTKWKPRLLVELNRPCLERFGAKPEDLCEALKALGYQLFTVRGRSLVPFHGLAADEAYTNLICVPR